jgi:hypothetical protein
MHHRCGMFREHRRHVGMLKSGRGAATTVNGRGTGDRDRRAIGGHLFGARSGLSHLSMRGTRGRSPRASQALAVTAGVNISRL